MKTDNKLSHYMSLPYTKIVVKRDDEDGLHYISNVLELDGCSGDGTTPEEALRNLDEAMECYLESCIIHGDPIPEPVSEDSFSGKFLIRVPKSLHRRLSHESQKEGVSLNQYALYKLSR